ncbi:MAG: SDR family NAD(P)-dependent oxidoreductase [Bacteroidetes bacterium]|nr:SDR family NAD(P)-dependent oxidoreductase [Bacteroidota bacterium]
MKFKNQVVWITGASSGIGREMALEFARQGASVALSARRREELETVAAEIAAAGGQAKAFPCDILQEPDIEACVRDVVAHFGRMDVAVANAGFGVIGRLEELSAADWQRQLAGNVTGLALTVRYALPHLRASKGRIGLVGSVAAFLPGPKTGAYSASKAAVHSIGETLQLELRGSGVTCTTMHPGFVESNIARVDNSGHFDPSRPDGRPAKLMWPTDRAARVMVRALARRQPVFVFTGHGKLLVFLGRHFPGVARWMISKAG